MSHLSGAVDLTDIIGACRSGDTVDTMLLLDLIDLFVEDGRGRVARLHDAVGADDRESLRQIAHSLSGSAAMVRAGHLYELARQVERHAADGDLADLRAMLAALSREFDHVVVAVRRAQSGRDAHG